MTPEEREARRLAEEAQLRAYEEARARERARINSEFDRAYRTYTTTSFTTTGEHFIERYRIDYDSFFTIHSHEVNPTPPTLNEQLQAAIQEADRCARRGDNLGRVNALNTARRLRVALRNQANEIVFI